MMKYLFLQIVSNNREQKQRVPDTYYINNNYTDVIEIMKITSNWKQSRQKKQSTERQKDSFPKESVENTDLYKPVLKKIITTIKL